MLFVDEDGESHPSPLSSQSLGTHFDNNGFEIYIAQPHATGCAVMGCAVCVDEDGKLSHASPLSSQSLGTYFDNNGFNLFTRPYSLGPVTK